MTREEALQILDTIPTIGEQVDALEMAIQALEQEPKQVDLEGDGYADGKLVYDYGKCPSCGWQFEYGEKDWEEPYCCHCGQKLKWFEESEDNDASSN